MAKKQPLKVWATLLTERAPGSAVAVGRQSAALVVAPNQTVAASLCGMSLHSFRVWVADPLRLDLAEKMSASDSFLATAAKVVGNPRTTQGVWLSTSADTVNPPADSYVKVR